MYLGWNDYFPRHHYSVFVTGIKCKKKLFDTRQEAESYMWECCSKFGITVECTECDKHERKYSNHCGVRFYINRI